MVDRLGVPLDPIVPPLTLGGSGRTLPPVLVMPVSGGKLACQVCTPTRRAHARSGKEVLKRHAIGVSVQSHQLLHSWQGTQQRGREVPRPAQIAALLVRHDDDDIGKFCGSVFRKQAGNGIRHVSVPFSNVCSR